MRLRSWTIASALALALATPALADISVLTGAAPGSPDTVTLSDDALDFFIDGVVGPGDTAVSITGSENLGLLGQSIVGDTGTFNFLLFTLTDPDAAFTTAEFTLDAAAAGAVSIFAYDQFGDGFGGVFALSDLGSNVFNVVATNNQIIRSIVVMSAVGLDEASDIRLGGITGALVPEPASWAMMIAGFGGVGWSIRSRRRTLAAA